MKKIISVIIVVVLVTLWTGTALAGQDKVVTLGANLTPEQRKQMLDLFGVKEGELEIIEVTIEEQRKLLKGIATDKQIGRKAYSSSLIELLDEGEGLSIQTTNITWVTKEMYANALVTAGVKDARVTVAAPFNVTGTAALTGIMKAFETATAQPLDEEAKKIAGEELVTTGELGEEIGKEKAGNLIKDVKEVIVAEKITDPEEIRKVIVEIAGKLDIQLSEEQIQKIISLMEKIGSLNLDFGQISGQLEGIKKHLEKISQDAGEAKGFLQKILNALESFIGWLKNLFS
ncbi:MAG TPA: DUF1002 domain-containing protein [Clostridiales bacterium]|nr:DUF1002 domain-containing protein [Clostridiales bacterium]